MNQELFEKIKNDVARDEGHDKWEFWFDELWHEVCDRYSKAYAKECIKASLEKAERNIKIDPYEKDKKVFPITDPENIVLL